MVEWHHWFLLVFKPMQAECERSRTTFQNTALNSILSITNQLCHYPKLRITNIRISYWNFPFLSIFPPKNYNNFLAPKCHYSKLIKITKYHVYKQAGVSHILSVLLEEGIYSLQNTKNLFHIGSLIASEDFTLSSVIMEVSCFLKHNSLHVTPRYEVQLFSNMLLKIKLPLISFNFT